MGAHRIGEIGITWVGAAVDNAVYNATGKGSRDGQSLWTNCPYPPGSNPGPPRRRGAVRRSLANIFRSLLFECQDSLRNNFESLDGNGFLTAIGQSVGTFIDLLKGTINDLYALTVCR